MVVSFLLASGLAACGGGGGGSLPGTLPAKLASNGFTTTSLAMRTTSTLSDAAIAGIAINAGSTTAAGSWVADTDYTFSGWGEAAAYTAPVNISQVTNPPPQSVYQSQRWAPTITYTIPSLTPSNAYTARLHFSEAYFKAKGQRVFNVKINGVQVLTGFDIYQAAGGANIAIAKSFTTTADTAGKIAIVLTATVNNAVISGVEVKAMVPTPTPTPAPIPSSSPTAVMAINSGSSGVAGKWLADTDFTYTGWGQASTYSSPINTTLVSNPAPQSVYQTQRWAPTIMYTLPKLTPNALYGVKLHFVESWFKAKGQRVFNIKINGTQVASNFDIFAAAGGENIAVAKTFSSSADAAGKLTIALAATVNNATISGVEITNQSSAAPPTAPPTPINSPTPVPSGGSAWVFSQYFGASSPMRTKISALKAQGASTIDHQYMDSFWRQGFPARNVYTEIPIYLSKSTDPMVTVSCTFYGGNCNAKGLRIHNNPANYIQWINSIQNEEDHHLLLVDQNSSEGPVELDCWQAGPRSATSTLVGTNLQCGWAGKYQLGGSGLHGKLSNQSDPGSEGLHFGPAAASYMVTGTEILNGHIDHALALNVSCLNNPSVYPADTQNGTDTSCDGSTSPPHYGNAIHLNWSAAQIAGSAYSAPCKTILAALADYGAYMSDTGDAGVVIDVEAERAYTSVGAVDPYPAIEAQLNAAGDANGGKWNSCFNRLKSSDFEMLQLAQP